MSRAVPILVGAWLLGCGPSASPESPRPPARVVPYEVTLAAGTAAARLDELAANGAVMVVEPHLEGDRYLVRMSAATADTVRGLAFVAAAVPLAPERRYAAGRFADAAGPVAVVVDLFEGADTAAVLAAIAAWGGEPVESAPHTLRARLDRTHIAELAAMPEVRWIEPR